MGNPPDEKAASLRRTGTLHPHPDRVEDELFMGSDFFDARDAVQVKYEMLRRVKVDGRPVARAATDFGFSRPSFYKAQSGFERAGMSGLLPAKKGPRRGHKLSGAVMEFLAQEIAAEPSLSTRDLVRRVREQFDVEVHPRSIARALARGQKKNDVSGSRVSQPGGVSQEPLMQRYEQLRVAVMESPRRPGAGLGESVVVRRGLAAWLDCSEAEVSVAAHARRASEALPLPTAVHAEL